MGTRYNKKDLEAVAEAAARRALDGAHGERRRAADRLRAYFATAEDPAAIREQRQVPRRKKGKTR
ncbi:MAG: hypothetical protein AABM42_03065 [Actinomycetota bacterium]